MSRTKPFRCALRMSRSGAEGRSSLVVSKGDFSMIGKEADDNTVEMEAQKTVLEQATGHVRKLADELPLVRKDEADNKRKMDAHQTSLEEAEKNYRKVKVRLCWVEMEKSDLETKLAASVKEKKELKLPYEWSERTLLEEREKRFCEICMESLKDSVCLPCLHLRYCFGCLEKHRELSRTCPCCRGPLNGAIRLDTSMFHS